MLRMKTYKKRQTKESLGLTPENTKGIGVENFAKGKQFTCKFKVHTSRNGIRITNGYYENINEARDAANKMFTSFHGSKKNAQKAGDWNF